MDPKYKTNEYWIYTEVQGRNGPYDKKCLKIEEKRKKSIQSDGYKQSKISISAGIGHGDITLPYGTAVKLRDALNEIIEEYDE